MSEKEFRVDNWSICPVEPRGAEEAVSHRVNALNIFDYSQEPSDLEDRLAPMSAHFAYKELDGAEPKLPTVDRLAAQRAYGRCFSEASQAAT